MRPGGTLQAAGEEPSRRCRPLEGQRRGRRLIWRLPCQRRETPPHPPRRAASMVQCRRRGRCRPGDPGRQRLMWRERASSAPATSRTSPRSSRRAAAAKTCATSSRSSQRDDQDAPHGPRLDGRRSAAAPNKTSGTTTASATPRRRHATTTWAANHADGRGTGRSRGSTTRQAKDGSQDIAATTTTRYA